MARGVMIRMSGDFGGCDGDWEVAAPGACISFTGSAKPCINLGMTLKTPSCFLAISAAAILVSCATSKPTGGTGGAVGFAEARGVIERNCVHCHGTQRLATMPSFNDTKSLASLRGTGKWIVPGQPEASRFLQVVTLSDAQPGSMPPTGHAISATEIAKLRAWIVAGAPIPEGEPQTLQPKGTGPRSR